MKPEEVRQLLGGYASGTLSEAERKLLFEAALEDQVLFDAMADEQALKDLLDDPESRGYLQAVLDESPVQPHLDAVLTAQALPAPQRMQKPVARRPAMWWGVLAAAALATVSVVGILRLNEKAAPVEMAKNTQPTPTQTTAGKQPLAAPAPAAAAEPEPKPVPSKAAKREADVKPADKAVAPPEPVPAAVANAAADRRAEEKQLEAQKPRDESAQSAPVIPLPTQAQAPPPPAPRRKEAAQGGALANPQVSQDQLQQLKLPIAPTTPGAKQLYRAGEPPPSTGSVDAVASRAAEVATTESSVKDQKAKKGGPASKAAAPSVGAASLARQAPGFAMRYKIFRKTGRGAEQVLPGTRFQIGDEVVVVIEKNSGGIATIVRIADGSSTVVALAIHTNEMVQSVPLTVTGPMELALILNRTGALRGIPEQPAAQRVEVADGMVYVAEPAAAAGKPLVVRVSIQVADAAVRK